MALNNPIRLIKALPYLADHIFKFRMQMQKICPGDKYQFGMSRKNFKKSISNLLNIPITTTLHQDASFVSDVDALEDWEDFESLIHFASSQGQEMGLEKIHPFGDELLKFREVEMPFLKKEIPMYQNFPAYLNQIYRELKMDYVPFDSTGNYVSPNRNVPEVEYAYLWYQQKCKTMCRGSSARIEPY